jgi:hypothetical protein
MSNGKLFGVADTLNLIRTSEIETTKCTYCGQTLQKNEQGEMWIHRESIIKCGYIGGVPDLTDTKQILSFVQTWLN